MILTVGDRLFKMPKDCSSSWVGVYKIIDIKNPGSRKAMVVMTHTETGIILSEYKIWMSPLTWYTDIKKVLAELKRRKKVTNGWFRDAIAGITLLDK